MSKLLEYIKLVPKGIKNIDKIAAGILNNVKLELGTIPEEDAEIIAGRRLICQTCPFMSVNATTLGVYENDRTDDHCIHCGCPIQIKTASLGANCGIEDFNEKNPNDQMELKWKAV